MLNAQSPCMCERNALFVWIKYKTGQKFYVTQQSCRKGMGQELLEVVNWERSAVHDIMVDVDPERRPNHLRRQKRRRGIAKQNVFGKYVKSSKRYVDELTRFRIEPCQHGVSVKVENQ